MRPNQAVTALEDLAKSWRGPLHRKGVELSLNDGQTVLEVYQQWFLLSMDLGYLTPDAEGWNRIQQMWPEMVTKDVYYLNSAFAELLHLIRCKQVTGFKALCRNVSTHLWSLIRDDVSKVSLGDVYAAKRLVQLFSYTGRLSLHDIDLSQQCLDEYLEIESKISSDFPEYIVAQLNTIVKSWLRSFDPTLIRFGHGPGGVAGLGRCSLEFKYKDLTSDQLLSYAFGDPWWLAQGEQPQSIRSSLDRVSQTVFVPKSYKTFRTISMEPSVLQYCQQGVWKEIDRVVSSSRYLRGRIGFHEQERNQKLARKGSIERNYATIDLSAASDSVSYALVKRIFKGTKLLRFLVATRSSRTLLPDNRLISLKKFAPMGSALCFPVETLIFAAICEYVTRGHRVPGDYSVFGDDIIVPTQCVDQTMKLLETLGFSVNKSKSFYQQDCWFRESCGAEFCDGYDVTPMRISRKYAHRQRLVQTLGLVQLANEAYTRDFSNLRSYFLRKLSARGIRLMFGPTSALSGSSTNFHLRKKWDQNLQKPIVRASAITTTFKGEDDELLRLRHWFESTVDRSSVDLAFVSRIGRPTVELQDRWQDPRDEQFDHSLDRRFPVGG